MKIIKLCFSVLAGLNIFSACQKDNSSETASLDASKTAQVQKGEPVVFKMSQVESGTNVTWSVNPSAITQVNGSGNRASILFGLPGNYIVTARSGNYNATSQVTVIDSTYNGDGSGSGGVQGTTLTFSAGDRMNITVSRIDSGAASGLVFSMVTSNSYTCMNNSLQSSLTPGAGGYTLNLSGVFVPGDCASGTGKSAGFCSIYPITEGAHTLTINFNGSVINGTITKSGNNYTISLTSTGNVTLSPTSL